MFDKLVNAYTPKINATEWRDAIVARQVTQREMHALIEEVEIVEENIIPSFQLAI